MSRAAFCKEYGLAYNTVSKWLAKISNAAPMTLLEVGQEAQVSYAKITVRLPGGVEVDFENSVSVDELARFCREVIR